MLGRLLIKTKIYYRLEATWGVQELQIVGKLVYNISEML